VSMLSSAGKLSSLTEEEKKPPVDNDKYVANSHGKSPKMTEWHFHDENA
jgi:hypothetical protein